MLVTLFRKQIKRGIMFSGKNGGVRGGLSAGSGGVGTAKRVIYSILETSGFVCGSLKDTVQEQLAEKDMDMKWVESEIQNIKKKIGPTLEKPKEQLLNLADKACRGSGSSGAGTVSPLASSTINGEFDEDNTTLDGTVTTTTEGRTLTVSTEDLDEDETTMASTLMTDETPPKRKSRFAQVVDETRKWEKAAADAVAAQIAAGGGTVVIGLCLSRNNSALGHPSTVTRQTAFDFNELQDRDYKYVSSTDESGWLAGGGERGDPFLNVAPKDNSDHNTKSACSSKSEDSDEVKFKTFGAGHKIAAPDRVHIPIIQINAASSAVIDEIISALARGEIFIPEVSILPESLSVNTTSPPDLVVRFGCEKNDDIPPEEWPNWCLEFLHNQLYDYFATMCAHWSKRPFQITLARKVRWMTVKHMNKYFARSEQVINSWREKGPQFLQPPYSDDSSRGVILEEITKPHGIYLLQNGVPTNYFAPNFHPPYSTKMRRSLIRNVINKSWDPKRRDWLSEPLPQMRGPAAIISSVMGCANLGQLSPAEEKSAASTLGAFHMRPDFDLVEETRDVKSKLEMKDKNEVGRKGERKSHDAPRSESQQQQHGTQRRQADDTGKEQDVNPMSSFPMNESFVNSTQSIDTVRNFSNNDPIYESRTNSGSMESPRKSQWSAEFSPDGFSNDEAEKNNFFLGDPIGRTSFCSTKDDTCTDVSQTESEIDVNFGTDPWHQTTTETLFVDQLKGEEMRTEKFAKTKVGVLTIFIISFTSITHYQRGVRQREER